MRKIALSALLCLSLILTECALAEAAPPDVDLSALSLVDSANALLDLAETPESSQGKVVRMKGYISYVEGMPGEPADFYLLCGDVTSCCATQIGIVPAAAPKALDPGMFEDTLITVQGALDIQDDEGYTDIRLIDTQVDWPSP